MKTTYILKLENKKYIDKLIRYHVRFKKIKYKGDTCFLYVDKENLLKLERYFDIYNISLVSVEGLLKYQLLLKKYYIFIISMLLGVLMLYLFSHITFNIKIMTSKSDLIKIIENELDYYGLKKYHLIKSYDEKEEIKDKILNEYKDKFEWIEIDRVGTNYYIRVLERIINKGEDKNTYQNIVAKRNAIIMEIKASNGQIMKKLNDYVNKGDIIISGNIIKNDEIKDTIKAEGKIYGETWYTVKVEMPHTYSKTIYTGNSYNRLTLNIFNKKFFLFGRKDYEMEETNDNIILNNTILPISLGTTRVSEIKKGVSIYTYDEALNKGLMLARERLLENIPKDSKILEQKKLKLYEENNKIIVEVFFKVYEDITDYQVITKEENDLAAN